MRNSIRVDLVLPSGAKYTGTTLPASRAVQDVINQLLAAASLPRLDAEGNQLRYDLRWEKEKTILSQVKGLVDQGVSDGESLRLVVAANSTVNPGSNGSGGVPEAEVVRPFDPNAKNVKVRINLSNLANQTVEETFPYDTKILDVLKQVHKKYKLHNANGVLADYQIVGGYPHRRTLKPESTLREEEIRDNDKLDFVFVDKAGASDSFGRR